MLVFIPLHFYNWRSNGKVISHHKRYICHNAYTEVNYSSMDFITYHMSFVVNPFGTLFISLSIVRKHLMSTNNLAGKPTT